MKKCIAVLLTILLVMLTSCKTAPHSGVGSVATTPTSAYVREIISVDPDYSKLKAYTTDAALTATHIFLAAYTGEYEIDGTELYLFFKPLKQLKGELVEDEILVTKVWGGFSSHPLPFKYEATPHMMAEGLPYFIYLEKTQNVYSKYPDHYLLFKQFEEWWDSDYDNVLEHPEYLEDEQRILDEIAKDPSSPEKKLKGKDFIRSENVEDIVKQSPTVLRVRVDGKRQRSDIDPSCIAYYDCTVLEVLKGNTAEQEMTLHLRHDAAYIGGEYIVMLDERGKISSPNSVYSLADLNTCKTIYEICGLELPDFTQSLLSVTTEKTP